MRYPPAKTIAKTSAARSRRIAQSSPRSRSIPPDPENQWDPPPPPAPPDDETGGAIFASAAGTSQASLAPPPPELPPPNPRNDPPPPPPPLPPGSSRSPKSAPLPLFLLVLLAPPNPKVRVCTRET